MREAIDVLESELGRRGEAMRACEAASDGLRREADDLRQRLVAREAEARELRQQIEDVRAQAAEELHAVAVFARQLEELRVAARGAATRIRLRALREAAEVNARLLDATDPRSGAVRDRMLDALERALDRIGTQWEEGGGAADAPVAPIARSAASRVLLAGGQVAGRRVSVDIGPFEDFSQLVRFEDAANAIGGTGDISIKRFSGGRAQIDVALSEPVDLLHELEENCDLEFRVRSRSGDEIVLDVED
ncbi:MAG: hypothetical protein R2718_09235 [Solirubrobacterales bacterium]|nr:hypothetical protein [Solirubrobacterales bacterium]